METVLEAVVTELLTQYADVLVIGLFADGITVPWPSTLTLQRHRVAVARPLLDMVIAADRMTVINTWERARAAPPASSA